jgi:hypothetical protein
VAAATLCFAAFACGASRPRNAYRTAVSEQEQCCRALGEQGAVERCNERIIRVGRADVATSDENQRTFACVEANFVCDAETGEATLASKQAQLDCINDLEASN